jgi:formylglycine-generating enzyme required for sulfatase activity
MIKNMAHIFILNLLTLSLGHVALAQTVDNKGFEAFKANVYEPILRKQCIECHSSDDGKKPLGPNHSSKDSWASYQMFLRYTNFADIKGSKFVRQVSNGHIEENGGLVSVTPEEVTQAISQWWNQGENLNSTQGKKVLPSQRIPRLSGDGNYQTMVWNLGDVDPELRGVQFAVDIQKFIDKSEHASGAYRLKNPRLSTNGIPVQLKSLNILMNGILNSAANNYARLDFTVRTNPQEQAVLSPYKQIMIESMGEGQDELGFALSDLKRAGLNDPTTLAGEIAKPAAPLNLTPKDELVVFNEAIVGKAGHFVEMKASPQAPIDFEMGSPETQENRDSREVLHKVRLTKSYEIQSTDVTQLQWYMVMKDTGIAVPSYFHNSTSCDPGNVQTVQLKNRQTVTICKNHPVEQVSWLDAQEFIKKLNQVQRKYIYRLPTEAQWEYVAKAGLPADYSYGWGNDFDASYAWFSGNSKNQTHEVGTKQGVPSPQDVSKLIYDMSGNVWQWVQDGYDQSYGLSADQLKTVALDPQPSSGSYRVLRGGGWDSGARGLCSGYRSSFSPGNRMIYFGFRLVRIPAS